MKFNPRKHVFVLASASPRRRLLLKQAGYRFSIVPSHVAERVPSGLTPRQQVTVLAVKKARWVARRHPKKLVLGADTLVFLDGKAIGKPRSPKHAAQILKRLSGRWQQVWTGVAVAWEGGRRCISGTRLSWVKFHRLSMHEIDRVAHRHLDKAGAYSVQSKKDRFVERIRGGYDNVVGLPVDLSGRLLGRAFQAFSKLL